MLAWSQNALPGAANVSRITIVDSAAGRRMPYANNLAAIRTALDAAGVEVMAENGGGAGVRLRKTSRDPVA
jgi:hypothetical protein